MSEGSSHWKREGDMKHNSMKDNSILQIISCESGDLPIVVNDRPRVIGQSKKSVIGLKRVI